MPQKVDELYWELTTKEGPDFRPTIRRTKDTLAREGDLAGRRFGEGIARALESSLRQSGERAGSVLVDQFGKPLRQIEEEAKKTGQQVGDNLGDGVRNADKPTRGLLQTFSSLRGVVASVVALLGVRQAFRFVQDRIEDATNLTKSYLQLRTAAKLFNVEQSLLTDLAAKGRTDFKLNAVAANELAVQVAKLAARAGEAERSQELLTRALDLGASQGLSAAEVGTALEQTLRGLDEGTDKLLQKNPEQIYRDFARGAGLAAGSLTDLQQKQALFNAVVEAGSRVQGSYAEILATGVGELTTLRQRLQTAREEAGQRMLPTVVRLATAFSGPLTAALRTVADLFEAFSSPLDRIITRMERLGQASETALPLVLQDRIEKSKAAISDLETRLARVGAQFAATSAPGRPGFGGVGEARQPGAALARDPLGLIDQQIEKTEELNAALREGDEKKIEALQEQLRLIKAAQTILEDIGTEQATLRTTSAALTLAEKRAALAAELEDTELRIEAIKARQAQAAAARTADLSELEQAAAEVTKLEELEQHAAGLREQLGRVKETIDQTPDTVIDPEKAAKAREQLDQMLAVFEAMKAFADQAGLAGTAAIPEDVAAQLQRVVQIREQLEAIRSLAQTAGGLPDEAVDQIAELEGELGRLQAQLGPAAERIKTLLVEAPPAIASIGELGQTVLRSTLDAIEPQSVAVSAALDAVKAAEAELTRATLAGDRQQIDSARKVLDERKDALREIVARLAEAARNLPEGPLRQFVELLSSVLRDANIETETLSGNLLETARSVEVAIRGLLQVGDALGFIDEQGRRALTSITDIVAGIGQISEGGPLGIASGITAIAGGVAGLFTSGREEDRKREEELRRNTEQLARVQEELRRLTVEIGPLTDQLTEAARTAAEAATAAGAPIAGPDVPGSGGPSGIRNALREQLAAVREEIERTGATTGPLIQREFELRQAFENLEKVFARVTEQVNQDLDLREAQLTGNQALVDSIQLRIKHEQELKDAVEAGLDIETIQRIRAVQQAEVEQAKENARIAKERTLEDLALRRLEAEGLSQTAAVRRLLIEQERELEDARKRGADAAELAAIQEAQLAEQREFVDNFIDNILLDAARRSGDIDAVIAIQQARLLKEFADAQMALEDLRDAGLLTEDEFLKMSGILKEQVNPALEELADTVLKEARDFRKRLFEEVQDLEDPEGAPERRILREADEKRRRARELFTGVELDFVLLEIDKWQELSLRALEKVNDTLEDQAEQEPLPDPVSDAIIRQITSISEVSAQGLHSGQLRLIRLAEERNALLEGIGAIRAQAQVALGTSAAQRTPPATPAFQGPSTLNLNDLELDIDIINRTGPILTAAQLIALLKRPEVMLQIDQQLTAKFREAERRAGIAKRN